MKRIAFIDVQNTEITTLKLLGFSTDNERLFIFLKDVWRCEKVFFYPGIEYGDTEREAIFLKLESLGAIVRPKFFSTYKNADKIVKIRCQKCNNEEFQKIGMGKNWKCNCDVEFTVDVLEDAQENTEVFLFSGDGDFEFLIRNILKKGVKVNIISSARKIPTRLGHSTSRLSVKLLQLTKNSILAVKFIEIDNLRFKIKKD